MCAAPPHHLSYPICVAWLTQAIGARLTFLILLVTPHTTACHAGLRPPQKAARLATGAGEPSGSSGRGAAVAGAVAGRPESDIEEEEEGEEDTFEDMTEEQYEQYMRRKAAGREEGLGVRVGGNRKV